MKKLKRFQIKPKEKHNTDKNSNIFKHNEEYEQNKNINIQQNNLHFV